LPSANAASEICDRTTWNRLDMHFKAAGKCETDDENKSKRYWDDI